MKQKSSWRAGVTTMIATVLLLSFVTSVIFTAARDAALSPAGQHDDVSGRISINRPSACKRYLNKGTDEWRRCMGVEYK